MATLDLKSHLYIVSFFVTCLVNLFHIPQHLPVVFHDEITPIIDPVKGMTSKIRVPEVASQANDELAEPLNSVGPEIKICTAL